MVGESMLIRAFFNADHFVEGKFGRGPVHTHSWMAEVAVTLHGNGHGGFLVGFSEIESRLRDVVGAFEGRLLNEMPEFRDRQPTSENICRVILERLLETCSLPGVTFASITLWESPTKGVSIRVPDAVQGLPRAAAGSPAAPRPDEPGAQTAEAFAQVAPAAERPAGPTAEAVSRPEPLPAGRDGELPAGPLRPAEDGAPPPAEHLPGATEVRPPFPTDGFPPRRSRARARQGQGEPGGKTASGVRGALLSVAAAAGVLLVAAAAYRPLWTAAPGSYYPWGSDTWGHLLKAELLYRQLAAGEPSLPYFAGWYNGVEPFRYWAPLPYYLLAGLRWLTGDIFVAGNLYVVLTAALGGVSWLAFRRYLGIWGSAAAGALWVVWADHVRVALSEGNLPRALATALLPLTGALFLRLLDGDARRVTVAGSAVLFASLVLAHAMIAAITALSLALFGLLYVLFGGGGLRQLVKSLVVAGIGVLLSGWWLLPSLKGGIVAIDPQAAAQAATFTPATVSFNPLTRAVDPERFYWGASLAAVFVAVVATWRHRPPCARAGLTWGLLCVLISLPTFQPVYVGLPLGNVLWPERFASGAALAFLLAAFARPVPRGGGGPPGGTLGARLLPVLAGLLLALDMSGSLRLITTRPPAAEPLEVTRDVGAVDGWRVATLDASRLGSAPSYWLEEAARREQVFGWAWQGATTAPNLVWVNTALTARRYAFALDRLIEMGATDLVLKKDLVDLPAFEAAAGSLGFRAMSDRGSLRLYHRELGPYLLPKTYDALAIGRSAANWAMLFPALEVGRSPYVDDYPLEELDRYRVVVLTGFSWRDKARAERLAAELAGRGKTVVVDLTGVEKEVLSKRARFLGVYAEPMSLVGDLELTGPFGALLLEDVGSERAPWETFNLQGLDGETVSTEYMGEPASVVGFKDVPGGRVWFVGANVPFHTYLTGDPAGLDLLSRLTGLSPSARPDRTPLPAASYRRDARGVTVAFEVPPDRYPQGGLFIVPLAALDSFAITLDGRPVSAIATHNLVTVGAEPGFHELRAEVARTPWRSASLAVSGAAALGLAAMTVGPRRRGGRGQ